MIEYLPAAIGNIVLCAVVGFDPETLQFDVYAVTTTGYAALKDIKLFSEHELMVIANAPKLPEWRVRFNKLSDRWAWPRHQQKYQ